MKAFHFRLKSLLDFRVHAEDQARANLAVEIGKQEDYRRELKELDLRFQEIGPARQVLSEKSVSGEEYMRFANWATELRRRIRLQMEKMAKQDLVIADKRKELSLRRQERKALDLLKDKHLKEWKKENSRKMTRFLDELGQNRFMRARGTI